MHIARPCLGTTVSVWIKLLSTSTSTLTFVAGSVMRSPNHGIWKPSIFNVKHVTAANVSPASLPGTSRPPLILFGGKFAGGKIKRFPWVSTAQNLCVYIHAQSSLNYKIYFGHCLGQFAKIPSPWPTTMVFASFTNASSPRCAATGLDECGRSDQLFLCFRPQVPHTIAVSLSECGGSEK